MEKQAGRTSLRNVSLGQICSRRVEYVDEGLAIEDVWKRMVDTGFSQFPIRKGEVIVGSLTERGVNRALLEADPARRRNTPVSTAMEDPFPVLSTYTPVAAAMGLLQHSQAVLVQEQGAVLGIVKNADIGRIFSLQGR
jgi:predicted transcriptional regulator